MQAFDPALWGAPLIVMAIGLVAGIALAVWRTGRDAEVVDAEAVRLDLERRRDAVIEAVRALDMERDKLSDEDYERQRRALLAHGAEAMRALEEGVVSEDKPESAPDLLAAVEAEAERLGEDRVAAIKALMAGGDVPEPEQAPKPEPKAEAPKAEAPKAVRISPRWEGALWTLGAVGVLVAIFLVLGFMDNTGQLPVEPMPPPQARQPAPPPPAVGPGPQEQAWMKTLESDPANLEALNGLTDFEIRTQDWQTAEAYNNRALQAKADDPEARTWRALLRYRAGSYAEAVADLDAVIADSPDFGRAHQFRGIVHLQMKEFGPALERFEQAMALATDDRTKYGLRQMMAEARQAMQGGGAGAPPPTPPPAAGGDAELAGTITLASGVDPSSWGPRARVYVSVKAASGPPMPLRAKAFPPSAFPLKFSLSKADAPMQGGPLPSALTVTVKVDLDGNAMGDDPGAPKVVIEGIRPGTSDLAVVLGG